MSAATTLPLVMRCTSHSSSLAQLAEAAACVRAGGLVAFPTETVYGIAAHAWDRAAVARLQQVKGRPSDKPFTFHLWDARQAAALARAVPAPAQRLMDALWPGPLTIILPGRDTPTVGLRLPDHPVARAFLQLCQVPVIAPSANRSGRPEALDAAQVLATIGAELDMVIDSGPTTCRQSSTVVDATSSPVRVLRDGAISRAALRAAGVDLQ